MFRLSRGLCKRMVSEHGSVKVKSTFLLRVRDGFSKLVRSLDNFEKRGAILDRFTPGRRQSMGDVAMVPKCCVPMYRLRVSTSWLLETMKRSWSETSS